MSAIYNIDGVKLVASEPISDEEADAYVCRGKEKYSKWLQQIDATIDGDFVGLSYTVDPNAPGFERIRRITGYLVGTLDRFNDGKRAEERDRVKHQI